MDWTHTKPPFGVPVEIFIHYGYVRRGKSDGAHVWLKDVTDNMQNAIYPAESVIAWRIVEECNYSVSP